MVRPDLGWVGMRERPADRAGGVVDESGGQLSGDRVEPLPADVAGPGVGVAGGSLRLVGTGRGVVALSHGYGQFCSHPGLFPHSGQCRRAGTGPVQSCLKDLALRWQVGPQVLGEPGERCRMGPGVGVGSLCAGVVGVRSGQDVGELLQPSDVGVGEAGQPRQLVDRGVVAGTEQP